MLVLRIERKRRLFPQNCIGQLPRALHRLARQTVGSRYCVSYRAAMLMRSPLARARRRPPGFIPPAKSVLSAIPTGPNWIRELKHDGYRLLCRKERDRVQLWSRNGRDWTAELVAIASALRSLPGDFVIDGEAVAHCEAGLPDFHRLAGGASKMQSAKDAANKLIDTMMGAQQAASKTKFSIVPFTLAVNVDSTYANASWMDTTGQSSIPWQNLDKANSDWKPASRFAPFLELGIGWAGCVETRPGSWATSDDSLAIATPDSLFVPMFAPDEPGDQVRDAGPATA